MAEQEPVGSTQVPLPPQSAVDQAFAGAGTVSPDPAAIEAEQLRIKYVYLFHMGKCIVKGPVVPGWGDGARMSAAFP